jgi:hypothetical protein
LVDYWRWRHFCNVFEREHSTTSCGCTLFLLGHFQVSKKFKLKLCTLVMLYVATMQIFVSKYYHMWHVQKREHVSEYCPILFSHHLFFLCRSHIVIFFWMKLHRCTRYNTLYDKKFSFEPT